MFKAQTKESRNRHTGNCEAELSAIPGTRCHIPESDRLKLIARVARKRQKAKRLEAERRTVDDFLAARKLREEQLQAACAPIERDPDPGKTYLLCGKCGGECTLDSGVTDCCRHHVSHVYTWRQVKARRERQWSERLAQMEGKAR